MKTQIKKIGTSKGIILPKEFLKYMKFKEDDWIDISDIVKVNSINHKGGKKNRRTKN